MIVGIDLGTTNSLVAYYTEEGPKIIPNRLGKPMTPSLVSIDEDGETYVAESAADPMLPYPGSGASLSTRCRGSNKKSCSFE